MISPQEQQEDTVSSPSSKPGFVSLVISTLAAAFGVQTDKNRERDFQHGNIYSFIAAGIIFTALFVIGTVFLVKLILAD
ncbi:DUF2970 domain-containing protein [Pseudoteredinibacter isoporae]|uniref:DUF2970 domain-containing protein n=1 Tax=Pseudoteredinibacter isoporae TaxID=570281 RepID=A0A7X0JXA1_9GAMM|nr:DUF2970 domain-containing protein [Pseudoteredinibacter isoporae]MBB6523210.1 hypothetical protein [Pseudoteredinibacter isoporae]NHO88728.1 DUF2970 domain-containing protein [Pseudoteredinibacter isoporae]NIB22581.1 DUF2970 domain-containing protein [Pseudoteredinibacter isoporae]